ncbi:MAG: hypothetical protein OEZ41_13165 [Nitrospirota bacterium]|nr:hypothetical protein [Nitrospirota bacterium]
MGFSHTTFQMSTSGFCDAENRAKRSEHHWNPVALWRGQVVLPTSEEGAHCLSAASLRAAGVGDTAQGTRRATPRPPWFWVLLPKQKDLVRRAKAGTKRYQEGAGSFFGYKSSLPREAEMGAATAGPAQMVST